MSSGNAAGRPAVAPREIRRLTLDVVTALAPADATVVSMVSDTYYENPATQWKTAFSLVRGRTQIATAFDDKLGSRILPLALLVIHGVGTGVIGGGRGRRFGPPTWWRRLVLIWRLGRQRAPQGPRTIVAVLTEADAAQAAGTIRWMATRAGLSPEETAAFVDTMIVVLTDRMRD